MGGGGSSSESSNQTQSVTEDNKVSATDNAIALGNEAQFTYTDEFSDNVKQSFNELVALMRDTGKIATEFAEKAIATNEAALKTVAENAQKSEELAKLQDSVLFQKFLPYAGVSVVLLILVSGSRRKGAK